ncbi:MAG: menaquinone biosynthesis protein [Planctomycetota bacterium]
MPKTRVGAVSYLNTKPLIHGLRDSEQVQLVLDLPSRLADQLAAGHLDVALIPIAEFLRHPEYRILSTACIACRGAVLSVKLYSRVPADQIETLALDEGSRTSALMARMMLAQRFGVEPLLMPLPIGEGLKDTDADATLLIGDRAIQTPNDGYTFVWDLGAKWREWYSPSFTFAIWAATERCPDEVGELLNASRDAGLQALEQIAAQEAAMVGLTHHECLDYLRDRLHFVLGPEEHRAIEMFDRLTEPFRQRATRTLQ